MTFKRKRKNVAILVGAGKGKRMGGKDKTFLNLSGQSVLAHSVSTFDM